MLHHSNKKLKIHKKHSVTLDIKHQEFLNEFSKDDNNIIPELKQERKELREKLKTDDLTVEQSLEIQDKIDALTEQIKDKKMKKKEYFLDNSKFIFEYFENKKNISVGGTACKTETPKSALISSFFKLKPPPDMTTETDKDKDVATQGMETTNIVQKYLSNVDEGFLDVNSFVCQTDICKFCYKGELIPIEEDGILVCNICSRSVPYLIENEKPSYKEPPKEVCFYAYKKINHFKEILAQFQGKETTQIPSEVLEQITLQIKKERIGMDQLTHYKTKEILKKLGFNKYYEHIAFIKNKLGIKPPVFSPELEDTLCNLFLEIQAPYAKTCPDYRFNFLNYYYVLYKLCELLGETEYLHEIPLLKDREKLIEHDETWKKICIERNWEFIPTV